MEKIKFQLEDGTEVEFYVEEQTRIGGTAYLLVSDSLDDEPFPAPSAAGSPPRPIFSGSAVRHPCRISPFSRSRSYIFASCL